MENVNVRLAELRGLMGKKDAVSEARRDEITKWLSDNKTPEVQKAFHDFMSEGIGCIETEIDTIRQQIGEEGYKLLPVTYIAEHYFGKTKAWLYQRINGTPIRGKVYTLNAEQKRIFNSALEDIAGKICSYRLA